LPLESAVLKLSGKQLPDFTGPAARSAASPFGVCNAFRKCCFCLLCFKALGLTPVHQTRACSPHPVFDQPRDEPREELGPLPSAAPLCFDGEDACFEAIMRGDVPKGSVVVIRYEGPRGAPGMPEMLSPSAALHSPPPVLGGGRGGVRWRVPLLARWFYRMSESLGVFYDECCAATTGVVDAGSV